MTKKVEITCDRCSADLMYTAYADQFRVVLSSENMMHKPGAVYAMSLPDPFPMAKHFCNTTCLKQWMESDG
jgi:hypothetical protein